MAAKDQDQPLLTAWLDIAWKHKWLMLVFGCLVMGSAVMYTRSQTKIYRAATQVVIDLTAPQYLPRAGAEVLQLGTGNAWNTVEFFETQYRIIRSRQVAARVVEQLGLQHDLDFLGVASIEDPERKARALEAADPVSVLTARLDVEPVQNSHVVLIRVKDKDPGRAAKIADAVAEAYAALNVNRKVSAAGEAVEWLDRQAKAMERDLKTARDALLAFKREHEIFTASLDDRQRLLGLDLQDARRQLRAVRQDNATLEEQFAQAKRLSVDDAMRSVPQVLNNGLVQSLKQQVVELENQRDELLKRYLPKHPDVRVVDEQLKRVNRSLAKEVRGISKSIERDYAAARRAEAKAEAEVARLQREAKALQGKELAYKRLAGEVESKKQLHSDLLLRLKEAELQAEAKANNVRILDRALVPSRHIWPRLGLNLAAAAVLALLGGIGLVLLVEQLDSSVRSQEQLEKEYGLTVLGIVPAVRNRAKLTPSGNADRYVIENPKSTAAECVRTVRTNLLFMSPEREMRSMLVTSPGPREGKTYTSVNVASTMALSGSKVLLVDVDLRRARVHHVFDHPNDRGVTNLVMNPDADISKLVRPTGVENMDVLCAGPLPPNPAELLHSPGFKRAFQTMLDNYDRVIIDSPPVVSVTDAQILGQLVDGVVMVVHASRTSRHALAKGVRLLRDVNVRIFGALLNGVELKQRGYARYYYRYYGQHPYSSHAEDGNS